MDIPAAFSAIGQAITVAKSLRDIDRSMDAATYKLKIAELSGGLADVKIALSDAALSLQDKDTVAGRNRRIEEGRILSHLQRRPAQSDLIQASSAVCICRRSRAIPRM
jgi:hypothetical protein